MELFFPVKFTRIRLPRLKHGLGLDRGPFLL
jgi:hypothetical protein